MNYPNKEVEFLDKFISSKGKDIWYEFLSSGYLSNVDNFKNLAAQVGLSPYELLNIVENKIVEYRHANISLCRKVINLKREMANMPPLTVVPDEIVIKTMEQEGLPLAQALEKLGLEQKDQLELCSQENQYAVKINDFLAANFSVFENQIAESCGIIDIKIELSKIANLKNLDQETLNEMVKNLQTLIETSQRKIDNTQANTSEDVKCFVDFLNKLRGFLFIFK